jgi:hypothetical protein
VRVEISHVLGDQSAALEAGHPARNQLFVRCLVPRWRRRRSLGQPATSRCEYATSPVNRARSRPSWNSTRRIVRIASSD